MRYRTPRINDAKEATFQWVAPLGTVVRPGQPLAILNAGDVTTVVGSTVVGTLEETLVSQGAQLPIGEVFALVRPLREAENPQASHESEYEDDPQILDEWPNPGRAGTMTEVSREEVNARLEAVEARAETRFVHIDGKLDRISDAVSNLTTQLSDLSATVSRLDDEVRREGVSHKRWIVGAVLTILFGFFAIMAFGIQAIQLGMQLLPTVQ